MSFDKQISRRTFTKGAAWSVPAVMVATNAPAASASPERPQLAGTVCRIYFGTGGRNGQRTQIVFLPKSSDGQIKKGDTFVYDLNFSNSVGVPQTNPNRSEYTMQLTPASGSTTNMRLTITAQQDNPPSLTSCTNSTPFLAWSDSASGSDPVMPPQTKIDITSAGGTRDGKTTDGAAGLSFTVPMRYPDSINRRGRVATRYNSRSGLQDTYPETRYTIRGNVDNGRNRNCGDDGSGSSTIYPDGTCVRYEGATKSGQESLPARP